MWYNIMVAERLHITCMVIHFIFLFYHNMPIVATIMFRNFQFERKNENKLKVTTW